MNLDDQLRTTLREQAEMRDLADLDVLAVMDGGLGRRRRARQRRTRGAALLALAVVAAGIGSLSLGRDLPAPADGGDSPATVADLPSGSPPRVPYCSDGTTIRGAGAPIAAACLPMSSHAGTTIGWDGEAVYRVADGRLTPLSTRIPSSWVPALSQDGRFAAWVTADPSPALLVYDVRDSRRLARVRMPTSTGWTAGIDGLGRVYFLAYGPGAPVWMYDIAARRLLPVRDVPPHGSPGIRFVSFDGFGLDRRAFGGDEVTGTSELGSVDVRGRFTSLGEVPIGWSSWSPDFDHVVQETAEGFWVQSTDDLDHHVVLELPEEGLPTGNPTWESSDTLLVTFHPGATWDSMLEEPSQGAFPTGDTYVLRCSTTDGDCEVALEPGWGGDLMSPLYR